MIAEYQLNRQSDSLERSALKTVSAGTSKASLSGKKQGRAKKAEGTQSKAYLVIDYPKNGEKLGLLHHYAIRIGAGGGESVEISIDDGTWHLCRQAAGYFWYDWHAIPKGTHKIVARMKLANGKIKKSKITRISVTDT